MVLSVASSISFATAVHPERPGNSQRPGPAATWPAAGIQGVREQRLQRDRTYTQTVPVAGVSPKTVSATNTTVSTTALNVSWLLTYTSTNPAQRGIASNCLGKPRSALTTTGRPRAAVIPTTRP